MYLKHDTDVSASNSFYSREGPPIQQGSPVTWHLAFWVLLTLATNSMAQRYAFHPDHSIYLHSSPLVCLADTILTSLRVVILSITLKISPQRSLKIMEMLPNDTYFSGGNSADDHIIKRCSRMAPQTWPRWMLFIMGTLPSAIKLQSFRGLPWTQAWGSMFLVSFIVNELIAMNSRMEDEVTTIPQLLGSATVNWHQVRQDEVRDKMFRLFYLNHALNLIEKALKIVVWFLQIIVFVRAGQQLWVNYSEYLMDSESAQTIIVLLNVSMTVVTGVGMFVDAYFRYHGYFKWMINERTNLDLLSRITTPVLVIVNLLPKPPVWEVGQAGTVNWGYITVLMYTLYARGCLLVSLASICAQFPRVAVALRIELRWKRVPREDWQPRGLIDVKAFDSMFFFIGNLLVVLSWYAYKYDSEGTLNPDWTDVFG